MIKMWMLLWDLEPTDIMEIALTWLMSHLAFYAFLGQKRPLEDDQMEKEKIPKLVTVLKTTKRS